MFFYVKLGELERPQRSWSLSSLVLPQPLASPETGEGESSASSYPTYVNRCTRIFREVYKLFYDPVIFVYRFRQSLGNGVRYLSSLADELHHSKGLALVCNNFVYSFFPPFPFLNRLLDRHNLNIISTVANSA